MRSTEITVDVDTITAEDWLTAMVDEFRQQIREWRSSGRVGVPVVALEGIAPARFGWCISCGSPEPGRWRCDACIAAIYRALELEAPTGRRLAPRRAVGQADEDERGQPWWDS